MEIISDYSLKYDFIKSITIDSKFDMPLIEGRYGYLCNIGFDFLTKYCKSNNVDWEYMGLIDADTLVNNYYFHTLIKRMNIDYELGITSGIIYNKIKESYYIEKSLDYLPSGSGRLIRKKCFNDIKGYEITPSPDSASIIKAILRGWKTKKYFDIASIQLRETSSKEGLWNGYVFLGVGRYYYRTHPVILLLNVLQLVFSSKSFYTLAFLKGYVIGYLTNKPRTNDKEIIYYYKYIRPREIILFIKNFIRNIVNI